MCENWLRKSSVEDHESENCRYLGQEHFKEMKHAFKGLNVLAQIEINLPSLEE